MAIKDFFSFRRMLTPLIIQVAFWIGLGACLIAGLVTLFTGHILMGLETLFIGPIIIRIICELVILFFRMNETLTDIRNSLTKDKEPPHDA